jgi:hypothetical protein
VEDNVEVKWYIGRRSTVGDVVSGIMDAYGFMKGMPGRGGGIIEYTMERVWTDTGEESEFAFSLTFHFPMFLYLYPSIVSRRLDAGTLLSTLLPCTLRVVVPDDWYRRPSSSSTGSTYITAKSTLQRRPRNSTDEEAEGTAKARRTGNVPPRDTSASPSNATRFSLGFDSWRQAPSASPSRPQTGARVMERMSVSDPILLELKKSLEEDEDEEEETYTSDFERMMVPTILTGDYYLLTVVFRMS